MTAFYSWWILGLIGLMVIWWKKPSIPMNQKKVLSYEENPRAWIVVMSLISLLVGALLFVDTVLRSR